MTIWTSPNGVDHTIDSLGRCATCGRTHETDTTGAAEFLASLMHLGGIPRTDPKWGATLARLEG